MFDSDIPEGIFCKVYMTALVTDETREKQVLDGSKNPVLDSDGKPTYKKNRFAKQKAHAWVGGDSHDVLATELSVSLCKMNDLDVKITPYEKGYYYLVLPLKTDNFNSLQLDNFSDLVFIPEEQYMTDILPKLLEYQKAQIAAFKKANPTLSQAA